MNKDLILKRFEKNLKNYDINAKIQKIMAKKLIKLITNKKPNSVLEIGCGTGFLTQLAVENISFQKYTAIDIVENCHAYISKISDKISFIGCDVEDFIQKNHDKFDLIISNATLQWVDNFENVINALLNSLNPNGALIFSTFGKENFREIFYLLGTTLKYYTESELQSLFPNIELDSEIHIMAFDSPKSVLKHLQATGVNAIEHKIWTKKDLINFEKGYKSLCVGRTTLTYNPIYARIYKN